MFIPYRKSMHTRHDAICINVLTLHDVLGLMRLGTTRHQTWLCLSTFYSNRNDINVFPENLGFGIWSRQERTGTRPSICLWRHNGKLSVLGCIYSQSCPNYFANDPISNNYTLILPKQDTKKCTTMSTYNTTAQDVQNQESRFGSNNPDVSAMKVRLLLPSSVAGAKFLKTILIIPSP